ncbi:hypothetical protein ACIA5D_48640 [Actinoplanes sp. NPDC051513]|uniref:hypothetical protein n=1 Tax=Actinoplanes sp. NPDC051513 TaxID=3363908 RepID=UPI0037BB3B3D
MPERDPETGNSSRLLRGLIWAGVLLAPVAAAVVLLGDSSASVRFAVLLVAVSVVLIGASVLIRNDPVLQRMHVEDRVAEEIEVLRRDLRAEFSRAAPSGPGFRPGLGASGMSPVFDNSDNSGFFGDAPMMPPEDDPFPAAPRRDPGFAGGGRASVPAPAVAFASAGIPQPRGSASVPASAPPRASASVRPGSVPPGGSAYGRAEQLEGDFGASNGYADMPAANGYADVPAANGYADVPAANGYADVPAANGYADVPAANGYADVPAANSYPVPGGTYGSARVNGPGYDEPDDYPADDYGYARANGHASDGYPEVDNGYGPPNGGGRASVNGYGPDGGTGRASVNGYGPGNGSGSVNGYGPANGGGRARVNGNGRASVNGYGPADAPNGYGPADGPNGYGPADGPNGYDPADDYDSYPSQADPELTGYGLDGGYDGPGEQSSGDPAYKARRHRPSANDTNVGTLADFAGYPGWDNEPQPDERYVQGYGRR